MKQTNKQYFSYGIQSWLGSRLMHGIMLMLILITLVYKHTGSQCIGRGKQYLNCNIQTAHVSHAWHTSSSSFPGPWPWPWLENPFERLDRLVFLSSPRGETVWVWDLRQDVRPAAYILMLISMTLTLKCLKLWKAWPTCFLSSSLRVEAVRVCFCKGICTCKL